MITFFILKSALSEISIYLLISNRVLVAQSCLTLCDSMYYSLLGFSVHGFSRQEYWSGLPFPSPGDLPIPGIEPGSPALQENSLPSELPGKPTVSNY